MYQCKNHQNRLMNNKVTPNFVKPLRLFKATQHNRTRNRTGHFHAFQKQTSVKFMNHYTSVLFCKCIGMRYVPPPPLSPLYNVGMDERCYHNLMHIFLYQHCAGARGCISEHWCPDIFEYDCVEPFKKFAGAFLQKVS